MGQSEDAISGFYLKILDALLNVDDNVTLKLANSTWGDSNFSIKSDYVSTLEAVYSASSHSEDFSKRTTVDIINSWCAKQTENRIIRFIDEISPDLRLILLNALYYHGAWTEEFEDPVQDKFTHSDGSTSTEWMLTGIRKLKYSENDHFKCIEIPYGNGAFVMDMILPTETGSAKPWASFTEETWSEMTAAMKEIVARRARYRIYI